MIWAFGLSACIVVIDQATKALVVATMTQNQTIVISGYLLRITYIRNPAAAFGLDIGSIGFYIIFSIVASIVVSYYIIRLPRRDHWPRVALAMILAGALGNLIDRLRFGEVIDFIQVGLSSRLLWPIFNVADMGVSVGVVLLMLFFLVVGEDEVEDDGIAT
jgi:signal peptidase II